MRHEPAPEVDGAPGAPSDPSRGSRRFRRTYLAVAVLVMVWAVAATALAAKGAVDARAGAHRIQALERSAGMQELLSGDVSGELERAQEELHRARDLLGNPVLGPVRLLPIAGRQLRAAHALARTADDVVSAATGAAAVVTPAPGAPPVSALEKVRRLRAELSSVRAALAGADLGPDDALVGPLHGARTELAESLGRARHVAARLDAMLDGVERVLTGPSRYIVLAANNAEMRIGSGMFLSIGSVEIADGDLRVDRPFTPAAEMVLPERIPLPPEVEERWGWSGIGADWRSLGLSARFPVSASLGAEMWAALSPDPVDGVFAVDVAALRSILQVTGPVRVAGETLGSEDVVDVLLHEQYEDADVDSANAARREHLSALGTAALEALGRAPLDLAGLLDALRPARDGRHLMAWSADPVVQRAWQLLGVDGDLGPRSLLVGLANIDGSKLDPYVDVEVEVSTHRAAADVTVELTIHLTNRAPDGLPDYVVGTDGSPAYRGLLSVHLPQLVRSVELSGFGDVVASGPDGSTTVVAATVDVLQGQTRTGVVRFSVPPGEDLDVEPGARLPPIHWSTGGGDRPGDEPWQLPLPGG